LGLAPLRRAVVALLAVEIVQIGVGLAQARLGLPELLVGIHMVLACVLIAVVTLVLLTLRGSESASAVAPRSQHELVDEAVPSS
jgi:cytochrome c oxidase assembly protein subunit 15